MESHSVYASHENYYSILYEEINSKPFEEAADIFKFLGLRMSHEVDTWITANTRKGPSSGGRPVSKNRVKRELDMGMNVLNILLVIKFRLASFKLAETFEYDDRIKMIYRDDHGHNFTRTKYLDKMPANKVSDTKSGMLDAPELSNNPPKGKSIYCEMPLRNILFFWTYQERIFLSGIFLCWNKIHFQFSFIGIKSVLNTSNIFIVIGTMAK